MIDLDTLKSLHDRGKISDETFAEQTDVIFKRSITQAEGHLSGKNGFVYILLGFFLGLTGVHNFYIGCWKRGLVQLLISLYSLLLLFLPLPAVVVSFWVLLEILFKGKDAKGNPLRGDKNLLILLRFVLVFFLFLLIWFTAQKSEFIWQDQVQIETDY